MRKQINPFQVRLVVMESGERLPLLVEQATGEPLYQPALYVLTQLRAKNLASATINQHCRAIMVLCFFLRERQIDLSERMTRGQFLSLAEVDALARSCRQVVEELVDQHGKSQSTASVRVTSLERVRLRRSSTAANREVGAKTASTRGQYIVTYLRWLVGIRATDIIVAPHPGLASASETALQALSEHLPSRGREARVARKGFTKPVRDRILEVIHPASDENPWTGDHIRGRNELIVRWLLHLGARRLPNRGY